MPKENKKRGRREEAKRKREHEGEDLDSAKRQKSHEPEEDAEIVVDGGDGATYQAEEQSYEPYRNDGPGEIQFYGMLDEQEQEYFKQADSTLEMNQFDDAEEKDLFLKNLWKEARGKELKIANSQSCSRLMERLIAASTSQQLKVLWRNFDTHFLNLFQHRFASHCCEALFRKTAPIVSVEMGAPAEALMEEEMDGDALPSMEDLFLRCVAELEGNLGYLITDQFASHPLRVLLVILSGMPLGDMSTTSLLQSKKKEHNVSAKNTSSTEAVPAASARPVPESFNTAVETIISGSTANLDSTTLRALATHPIANPVLQLLLALSLSRSSKQTALKDTNSLFRRLLPDDPPEQGTESAGFISHLSYDPIGSRLLEVIVTHAPGKTFKTLFRSLFKEKLGSMARNETAAFVVIKILERLGQADLESAKGPICDEIPTLVQRSRTGVVKTLIERSRVRELDETSIADTLRIAYGDEPAERLRKMLNLAEPSAKPDDSNMSAERKKQLDTTDTSRLNGSLLAQAMLTSPGPLRNLITDGLLATEMPALIAIAEDRAASRVLQAALKCPDQDAKFRRQLMPLFYPHVAKLATHAVASHVVDALWEASTELRFVREQIAEALLADEAMLRGSIPGRAVWRNWNMDMYKTRRRDWLNLAMRGANDGPDGGPAMGQKKTAIQLARERHAQKQSKGRSKGTGKFGKGPSGANAVAVK